MKRRGNTSISFLLILCLGFYGVPGASAVTEAVGFADDPQTTVAQGNFSPDELDQLLGPVALYPDPLLAQMFPASTYVDQLFEAQRLLNGKVDESLIDRQNWDVSVKAIAHYPEVLRMMTQNRDWTTALGQAVAGQTTDVMKSVQRLRQEAKAAGHLNSNEQMTVGMAPEAGGQQAITIEPTQAQTMYVPQYSPSAVYYSDYDDDYYPGYGLLTFGTGLAIGAWLNRGLDWFHWGFPYHGWVGRGWIARGRPYVNLRNAAYVNNRFRNAAINNNILRRDISNYRGGLRRNAELRNARSNAIRNRPATRPALGGPGTGGRPGFNRPVSGRVNPNINRPGINRPGTPGAGRVPTLRPSNNFGRPVMNTRPTTGAGRFNRPTTGSAFGGYRSNTGARMGGYGGGYNRPQFSRGYSGGARMSRGSFGGSRSFSRGGGGFRGSRGGGGFRGGGRGGGRRR